MSDLEMLATIILFWSTVSATNLCFPFWTIYLPRTGVAFGFILIIWLAHYCL
jgi:hypothetical protein